MSDIQLTKDSEKLICSLYKNYLEQRKNGISKANAKCFGSSHNIHENIVPEWTFEDVDETCRELNRNSFLNVSYYDDICGIVILSDNAIVYMENRFKNGIKEVSDFISKFIP